MGQNFKINNFANYSKWLERACKAVNIPMNDLISSKSRKTTLFKRFPMLSNKMDMAIVSIINNPICLAIEYSQT